MVTVISQRITIPATLIVGGLCHLLLRTSRWYSVASFGAGGFMTGVVLWTLLTRGAPPGHFIFGTVLSALTIGGPAGFVAGKTFARRMMTG